MHSALVHRAKGLWPESHAEGSVTLDFDARHSRCVRLTTDHGEAILLDLPHAVVMAGGDGLRLGDGRWIAVHAAPEPVVEVHHHDPQQSMRLAWHLGNRRVPAEIRATAIRIRPDRAIEEMLIRAGAQLTKFEAPFHPESGTYGNHGHDAHEHAEDREHRHDNDAGS
ncbi:MAG: urease accessory protein UreE [Rhodomicrobium sp.]